MEQETGQHIQEDNHQTEEQKRNNIDTGWAWSAWTGTNVVERFVGLRFRISPQGRIYKVSIKSGGNHAISWNHPGTSFNDRNKWFNDFLPLPPGVYYNIWVYGDITEVHLQPGLNAEYIDFYNPGRGTPVYVKVNNNVVQTWNPIQ